MQVPYATRHYKPYVYIEDRNGWGFPMKLALLAGALVLMRKDEEDNNIHNNSSASLDDNEDVSNIIKKEALSSCITQSVLPPRAKVISLLMDREEFISFGNKAEALAFLQEATILDADATLMQRQDHSQQVADHQLPLPSPLTLPTSGDKVYITWVENPNNFRKLKVNFALAQRGLNPVFVEHTAPFEICGLCDMQGFIAKCVTQSNIEVLSNMMEAMHCFYEIGNYKNQSMMSLSSVHVGQVFAGLYEDLWYRVAIKQVLQDQAAVFFVDYGDYNLLPVSELKILPMQFRKLPFQAIKAKLAGVHHPGNGWSPAACTRMEELVLHKTRTAWVHGMQEDFLNMTLLDEDVVSGGNAFVHKILLNEGLAITQT